MKSDVITETATEDLLIILYGEHLLKRNNGKRSLYHISNTDLKRFKEMVDTQYTT